MIKPNIILETGYRSQCPGFLNGKEKLISYPRGSVMDCTYGYKSLHRAKNTTMIIPRIVRKRLYTCNAMTGSLHYICLHLILRSSSTEIVYALELLVGWA